MTSSAASAEPLVLRLRSPTDLLEAVPYLFGFHPQNSLVAIAMRGRRHTVALKLRVDLPRPEHIAPLCERLVHHLRRCGADEAVLVVYGDADAHGGPAGSLPWRDLVAAFDDGLAAGQVILIDALYVAHGRWWSYQCTRRDCCPPEGTPLRADGDSAVAAAAAYLGRRALPDRAALAATLEPMADVVGQMRQRLERAAEELAQRSGQLPGTRIRAETVRALRSAMAACRDGDGTLDDDAAARLIVGLTDVGVRDAACEWVDDTGGPGALSLWIQLAQRAVPPWNVPPLTLVAWTSWQLGDGTLARIAVDRALATDPDYTLAGLIGGCLDRAIDPAAARRLMPRTPTARGRRSRRR